MIETRVVLVGPVTREGRQFKVGLHELTDTELRAFAAHYPDPLEGWKWARRLADVLAGQPRPEKPPT